MTAGPMVRGSIAASMDERAMTFFQWRAVAMCCLINMMDGFDVMVMAFTASALTAHWSLTGTQLGYLLSAGLLGMTVGSLFVAPWADRVGRRSLTLACVVVAGFGMILSSYAQTPLQLGLLRFCTGLGIGGILASSYVIAGEYASKRWRSLAISLQATAYAIGATVGGFLTAKIIGSVGWSTVFLYGGLATLAALPFLLLWLPESIDFYVSRRPKDALDRVNNLLQKMGMPQIVALPNAGAAQKVGLVKSLKYLLTGEMRTPTLLIWISFFLIMFGFYLVMSWSPRLLVAAGLSNEQGISGGVLLNLGGILGTSLIGLLAVRVALHKVHGFYLLATAVLMCVLLAFTDSVQTTLVLAFVLGVFVNGCVAGMFATTPMIYESAHRVTGMGWGIGMGRFGSILAPLAAGPLVDAAWRPDQVYTLYSAAFILAAISVALLAAVVKSGPRSQRHSEVIA